MSGERREQGVQSVQDAFRVSVCLSQYFSDERARVRVAVDGRWARVAALARYLRATFRLPGAFCLVSEGHLLPCAEPLAALLRDGETVAVVPLEKHWQHCTEEQENSKDEDEPVSFESKETSISMEKVIKKKKKKKLKHEMLNPNLPHHTEEEQCQGVDNEAEMPVCDVTDTTQPPPPTEAGGAVLSEPSEDTLQQLKLKALALLGEVAGRGVVSGGRVTKRKRVRRRARASAPTSALAPNNQVPAAAPPQILNNTHTRFEDCGNSGAASEEGEVAVSWCGDRDLCRDSAETHGVAEVSAGSGADVVAKVGWCVGGDGVAAVEWGAGGGVAAADEWGAGGDGGAVLQNTPPPRTHPHFVRALPAPAPSTQ